jgi:hypothetical protein
MITFTSRLRSAISNGPTSPTNIGKVTADEKNIASGTEKWNGETQADRLVDPGELSVWEDAQGGRGRHLGLFSTTFLM